MTKSQIKAELRRAACCEDSVVGRCAMGAWYGTAIYWDNEDSKFHLWDLTEEELRIFMLLSAEAL